MEEVGGVKTEMLSNNVQPAPSRILTISEVGAQLRFSTNTLRKLLNEGRLKGVRTGPYGGKWRISQKAIDEFIRGPE